MKDRINAASMNCNCAIQTEVIPVNVTQKGNQGPFQQSLEVNNTSYKCLTIFINSPNKHAFLTDVWM